jgi:hypothetical protein
MSIQRSGRETFRLPHGHPGRPPCRAVATNVSHADAPQVRQCFPVLRDRLRDQNVSVRLRAIGVVKRRFGRMLRRENDHHNYSPGKTFRSRNHHAACPPCALELMRIRRLLPNREYLPRRPSLPRRPNRSKEQGIQAVTRWHAVCSTTPRGQESTVFKAMLTSIETSLVIAYRGSSTAAERGPIIQRYAELARLSMGRAEDALDLWAYMLGTHTARH